MILQIAGGSSMEFQTKKQKKDHLRLMINARMFFVLLPIRIDLICLDPTVKMNPLTAS
jgi:hypothetical protein